MTRREPDCEPDFEAIQEARDEARAERQMRRLDNRYGRIEDWRTPKQEAGR